MNAPIRGQIWSVVNWADTDASGHYHFSTVLRWVEAAEADLYDRLGLASLFGSVPRAHFEVDFLAPVWFRDEVKTIVWIERVGDTSMTALFEIRHSGETIARGSFTVVHVDGPGGSPSPWPDGVRHTLAGTGLGPCISLG